MGQSCRRSATRLQERASTEALGEGPGDRKVAQKVEVDRRAQECAAGCSSFAVPRRHAADTRQAEPAAKAARMTMSVGPVENAKELI